MSNKTPATLSLETSLTRTALTARTFALCNQKENVVTAKLAANAWVHANSVLSSLCRKSAVNDAEYAALAFAPDSGFKETAIATLENRIERLGPIERAEYLDKTEKIISDRMTDDLEPFERPVLIALRKMRFLKDARTSATHG